MGEKARNTLPAREIILACFVKSSNLREFTCLKQSHNQAQINSLKFAAAPASTISKEVHYDPRTNPHHRLITRTNSRTGEYSASTAQHRRKSASAQRLHLSSIIKYCQAINSLSKQINQTLSKLMLERQYVFANTQLVNDDEMLQFSGIFSTLLESLTSSTKRIHQQSLAIKLTN